MKKLFFLSAIALLIFATLGCDKKENSKDLNINNLSYNYCKKNKLNKTIIGTWKCIGFGDTKTGKIKPIQPTNCDKCYVITFKEYGVLNGFTSSNKIFGNYEFNNDSGYILLHSLMGTEVNELCDGKLYVECLSTSINYSFSDKDELLLYFNNKKECLIFKFM